MVSGSARFCRTIGLILLVAGASAAISIPRANGGALSTEERVAAQRAIEEVYWRHRIWPQENPQPKPTLSTVLPDEAIRARVDDALRKSAALEKIWSQPLTGAQLQAEIDRMARETRDPATLRELFAALGNDPQVIAETLARAALAERLVHSLYIQDPLLHAAVRDRAERALAGGCTVEEMKHLGGEYVEMTVQVEEARHRESPSEARRKGALDFEAGDWEQVVTQLADRFARVPATPAESSRAAETTADRAAQLPLRLVSRLREESDRFSVVAILQRTATSLTLATVSWPKRSLDAWWVEARTNLGIAGPGQEPVGPFTLPTITGSTCVDDTWAAVKAGRQPTPRNMHSAVWTGAEMIIWGGTNSFRTADGGRYDPSTDTWTLVPVSASSPAARFAHTAVWTGTEMIVWGGYDGSSYLNTGGRYAPQTDTWMATSTGANVPTNRRSHTAVWTGTEMIVWGGSAAARYNTGARYNPSSDVWTPTSVGTNVPAARNGHTAVWTDTEMIVWGGVGASANFRNGGRYNPSTDAWTPTSVGTNVPAARNGHGAVWTGTEMIVWGGVDASYNYLNTGARYNPSSNTWNPTSVGTNVPSARSSPTAVWARTEMIIWGGVGLDGNPLASGGRYTPASDSWASTSAGANVPTARYNQTGVWTGTELIVWGGVVMVGTSDSGARYNPATDAWTTTFADYNLPTPRYYHVAIWTGAEMIVWGGYGSDHQFDTGSRYNPTTNSWTATPFGPAARVFFPSVWTGTEMIVWGGLGYGGDLATGSRYNPTSNLWTTTSTTGAPAAREYHTAVWTGTEMIVWGGWSDIGGGDVNSGGRYSPGSNTWTATSTGANVPPARDELSSVWTGSEMIVWGGDNYYGSADHAVDTGGRYSPSSDSWTTVSVGSNHPSPRWKNTAVWTGNEMVIWGGWDGSIDLNSGARYNPGTDAWTATSQGSGVPSPRQYHSGVWTGSDMIVWGGGGADLYSDGARYNPALDAWTPVSTSGAPGERYVHSAVWTGSEMIVWGGADWWYLGDGARYCVASCSATPPSGATSVGVTASGTTATIDWTTIVSATTYDVVRGGLLSLAATAGDYALATGACLANDTSLNSVVDANVTSAGDGDWYLVRGANCGGAGTYDEGAAAQQGSRDAEIGAAASACP